MLIKVNHQKIDDERLTNGGNTKAATTIEKGSITANRQMDMALYVGLVFASVFGVVLALLLIRLVRRKGQDHTLYSMARNEGNHFFQQFFFLFHPYHFFFYPQSARFS